MRYTASFITFLFLAVSAYALDHDIRLEAGRSVGPRPQTKIKYGDVLKDFQLKDVGGNVVDTAKIRKDKKLVFIRLVNIDDALWEFETDNIRQVAEKYPNDVVMMDIVVVMKDEAGVIDKYENLHVGYNVLIDKDNIVNAQFGVQPEDIPSIFIFDGNGKLLDSHRIAARGLSERIDAYLKRVQ